uniref:S26 family signal peptidase n=1 Tax=Geoglobus ahangari TaxID=113653 RepID=A0A7C4S6U1_9EURY
MGLIKDLLSALIVVGIIALGGHLITGTWPFMVAIESGSMEPNMHIGDVVFLVSPEKKEIITFEEGAKTGYEKFGRYGDVIVYIPNGDSRRTPIIHRAIAYVEKGDPIPILVREGNQISLKLTNVKAPSDGYITQGDANSVPDQLAGVMPVKEEWVVGVAVFKIPYIGYVRVLISKIFLI